MIRLLVKVYKVNKDIEQKLMELGNVELVSRVFNLYAVETLPGKRTIIEGMSDVISVREESNCKLMPII